MRHTEVELGLKKIITEIYQREREKERELPVGTGDHLKPQQLLNVHASSQEHPTPLEVVLFCSR